MRRNRKTTKTRLIVEQLEPRAMLSADGLPGSTGNEGGGLPGADLGTAVSPIAPGGYTGAPAQYAGLNPAFIDFLNSRPQAGYASAAPDAASGVGQMTITNGANTPGIGSFAIATCGFNTSNSTGSG
jgi:hypothetical protein